MSLQTAQYKSSVGATSYNHYYLCNYKPRAHGNDELSKSLLRFKSKLQVDVQAWIECSVTELSKIIHKNFIVVRALHGDELQANNSSLDHLGAKLSETLQCQYRPELIKKSRITGSLKVLKKEERQTELKNIYTFNGHDGFKNNSFLIIDDILTTGTTLKAIAEAITAATDNTDISFYSLAYTDYPANLNQNVVLTGNSYSWQNSQGWIAAEEESGYGDLKALKIRILDNFQSNVIKASKTRRR